MVTIAAPVGMNGRNDPDDVRTLQTLLGRHADWLAPAAAPTVSGTCDQATITASTAFQRDPGALLAQDGRVDPGGFTLRWLSRESIPNH